MRQPLPPFDALAVDRRFMVEISCLIEQGYFTSYRELATQLGVQHNTITEIGKGRYYCNLKLIYQAAALYPELDICGWCWARLVPAAPILPSYRCASGADQP